MRLGSSIFLLAFLPFCRIHVRVITRNLILQPYRSLQQLLEGRGLICLLQHRRFEGPLQFIWLPKHQAANMGLRQSIPHQGVLSPWISHGKVFLCTSWSHLPELQSRSLGRHPGSCGPGSLLVLCPVGSRIQFSAVRAVSSEALCKSFPRS